MNQAYLRTVRKQFLKRPTAAVALGIVALFCLVGIYAPFLASSKPIVVVYDGTVYFPLFRYLFYTGFYTKHIDIFFNLLIFTFPLIVVGLWRGNKWILGGAIALQLTLFLYFGYRLPQDPAADPELSKARQEAIQKLDTPPTWDFYLKYMTDYRKLNLLIRYRNLKVQNERLQQYRAPFQEAAEKQWLSREVREQRLQMLRDGIPPSQIPSYAELQKIVLKETPDSVKEIRLAMPTLWNMREKRILQQTDRLRETLASTSPDSREYRRAQAELNDIEAERQWYQTESEKISFILMPLLRDFHWEDDAGGQQNLNQYISWYERTRINRKDMLAALVFGVRISLVVGLLAVTLALIIGVPIGAIAGYYAGKTDIIVSRLLEIWESMPVFFMLLLVVAITQSKSIFIVISVIGLFGWTSFSRYIRGEFFKQRNLPYVEACYAQGFKDRYIIFNHILPNAIPPLLTLLPFAVMAAITSEAALSFLGLGEEGSASWGVLMDEGRAAFPGESYLLWPPAILLTVLLISIALVGDALRDALDPKMHR
jgi:peptide/nickel transport system permease protein